mmetsp:Transcript_150604/g.419798  ORF Transcript_150604/g.419798 Transcript_150604/m.419798 type:complete len:1039 (-) Transcript_150604:96-3212(-)
MPLPPSQCGEQPRLRKRWWSARWSRDSPDLVQRRASAPGAVDRGSNCFRSSSDVGAGEELRAERRRRTIAVCATLGAAGGFLALGPAAGVVSVLAATSAGVAGVVAGTVGTVAAVAGGAVGAHYASGRGCEDGACAERCGGLGRFGKRRSHADPARPVACGPSCAAEDFDALLGELREHLAVASSGAAGRPRPGPESPEMAQLVEKSRLVAEALAWGERHEPGLFDLFCERRMLASFVSALCTAVVPPVAKVQLLQTLSVLLQNARRETSVYYVLSGGHLTKLFQEDIGADADEELAAWFVAFLKSVALRLDGQSARLCLGKASDFPLFARGAHFARHSDPMVQTSARTALLTLLRIDDPQVRAAAIREASKLLMPQLAQAFREAWTEASVAQRHGNSVQLQGALEAEEDLLGFAAELLGLGVPALSEALVRDLLAAALLPQLAVLTAAPAEGWPRSPRGMLDSGSAAPTAAVAVRAVATCLRALGGHGCVVDPLVKVLLWPSLPAELCNAFRDPPGGQARFVDALGSLESLSSGLVQACDHGNSKAGCSAEGPGKAGTAVAEPNPLREALLRLLGNDKHAAPVEAAFAAWAIYELQTTPAASRPVLEAAGLLSVDRRHGLFAPSRGPPARAGALDSESCSLALSLLQSLRAHSRLPRSAQRAASAALVELLGGPCAQGLRLRVLGHATAALREAAAGLLAFCSGPAPDGGTGAEAVSSFLEEWHWHALQGSVDDFDVAGACGGMRGLQQSSDGEQSGGPSVVRIAALAVVTLLRLLRTVEVLPARSPTRSQAMWRCPLRAELDIGSLGPRDARALAGTARASSRRDRADAPSVRLPDPATEAVGCVLEQGNLNGQVWPGDSGLPLVLVLHSEVLLLVEPCPLGKPVNSGARTRVRIPMWQVTAVIDPLDPHVLRITAPAPAAAKNGPDSQGARLVLRFASPQEASRSQRHLGVSQACEVSRLQHELAAFLRETIDEHSPLAEAPTRRRGPQAKSVTCCNPCRRVKRARGREALFEMPLGCACCHARTPRCTLVLVCW